MRIDRRWSIARQQKTVTANTAVPPLDAQSVDRVGAAIGSSRESRAWRLGLFALGAALLLIFLFTALRPFLMPVEKGGDHYTYLAQSFMEGKLSVDTIPDSYADIVRWHGHKYVPFGPLPALLLIPFLPLLEAGLPMVTVGHLFTLVNIWLFYTVLGQVGVVGTRRNWALLLFFFSTSYFSSILDLTVDNSWLFAQVITTTCLLLGLRETFGKRRPFIMGLYLGLAALARFTTLFSLPLFVWMLWRGQSGTGSIRKQEMAALPGQAPNEPAPGTRKGTVPPLGSLLLLAGGLGVPLLILFMYNYLRFSNPLESGYSQAVLYYNVLDQARAQGLFSLVHIPKNLFMFLLQGPLPYPSVDAPVLQFPYLVPSPWGMSILLTSPALLYAFRARRTLTVVQACWLGVLSTMVPILTYYGVGYVQFGYRYALDFIPFLVILAALGFQDPPSKWVRNLVLAGMLVNVWGVFLLSHR